jgi:nitrogen regulatory protein PII
VDYQLITCIVERGRAEAVADVALDAGAQGVTIFGARGKGVRERLVFIGHLIDPEKEVVLTVTRSDQARAIFDAMVKAARIAEPGRGFAFMHGVDMVAGFVERRKASAARRPAKPVKAAARGRRSAPARRPPRR